MAKRVTKSTETSAKQTAATRRTKKTSTPTKKAPAKKPTATSGNATEPKKEVTTPKKTPAKKPTATSGKKTPAKKLPAKKSPVKKTTTTTLAAVARYKAENEAKAAARADKARGKSKGPKKEYYVIPANAPQAKFNEMGEKVRLGEAKWTYYAIDGDIGYHHYEKLK